MLDNLILHLLVSNSLLLFLNLFYIYFYCYPPINHTLSRKFLIEKVKRLSKKREVWQRKNRISQKINSRLREIAEKYDNLLGEKRKAHLQTLEKWKEDSEMNSKINRKFIESLKGDIEEIRKKLCGECREKLKKILGDKENKDENTEN